MLCGLYLHGFGKGYIFVAQFGLNHITLNNNLMTQKKLITLVTILICCMGLGACKEKDKPVEVKISIPEAVKLLVGETYKLEVNVYPKDLKVTFESTNTQVVTVCEKGVLKAIAEGEAEVKATAGNVTKVCKVSVTKPNNIDKSRYLGLDASAEDQQYFAPIYIPKEEDFKPDKLDLFKSAVTPFGWIYQADPKDPECKKLYRFVSPNKKDENGKEMPENAQFCMDFLAYNHSMPGAPVHIRMGLYRHFAMDYLVKPETFTEPKDLKVQQELLKIMEHYGFTEDGQFTVLGRDNAYVAYNTKFDPKTPLRGVMFTEREEDHPGFRLTFQISYGRR